MFTVKNIFFWRVRNLFLLHWAWGIHFWLWGGGEKSETCKISLFYRCWNST
jgi:hypothetical protein